MALSLSCIRLLSGATVSNPVGSSAEENVMCHANDRYKGEDITVHEFAHSMHLLGLTFVYESFEQELQTLYQKAKYLKMRNRPFYSERVLMYMVPLRSIDMAAVLL